MASLWASRMKDKVIGPGKPKEVSKNPWEHRIRKVQECPRKVNVPMMPKGTQEPASNVIKKPNDHTESLREE